MYPGAPPHHLRKKRKEGKEKKKRGEGKKTIKPTARYLIGQEW
jgi:hypothetical protein